MAVTFDAEILRERDGELRGLGETIFGAKVDSEDVHSWLIFACIVARVIMISGDHCGMFVIGCPCIDAKRHTMS